MFLYTILSTNSSISQHKRVTVRTNMQETDINFIKKIKNRIVLTCGWFRRMWLTTHILNHLKYTVIIFTIFCFAKIVIYSKILIFCASLYTRNMQYVYTLWDLRTEILHIFNHIVANNKRNMNALKCIKKQWLIICHWTFDQKGLHSTPTFLCNFEWQYFVSLLFSLLEDPPLHNIQ